MTKETLVVTKLNDDLLQIELNTMRYVQLDEMLKGLSFYSSSNLDGKQVDFNKAIENAISETEDKAEIKRLVHLMAFIGELFSFLSIHCHNSNEIYAEISKVQA
jgi:hypothetical protein